MPWAEVHWRSEVLQKHTVMQVFLPTAGRPPYATWYLLHGLGGDSTVWMRRSRLEDYVFPLPLLVVMPDGYRGFYTDHAEGPAYARHFGEEIPDFVEHNFPARASRGARAIGGASMGGYGALRVGLGYPERFCSVNSHSGALMRYNLDVSAREAGRDPMLRRHPVAFFRELQRIFGRKPLGTRHDLLALARRARRRGRRLPRMLIDCGTEDPLLEFNRTFHRELEASAVPHVYREHPGGHTWDYWDAQVRDALEFHARNLHLPATPTAN